MRGSSRIIVAVLVVVGAAAAAAPLVTAGMAEQRMRTLTESNPFEPSQLAWELTRYESGYLRAQATSELRVVHPETGESVTLTLDHAIDHALAAGDSLLRIRTVPRIPEGEARALVERLFGERAPLTIDYRMRLDGTSITRITSPSTEGMRRFGQGALDWQGLEGRVAVPADQRTLRYRFEAPGLRIEPDTGDLDSAELGPIHAEGAFERSAIDGIWVGGGDARIAYLRTEGPPEGALTVSGIELAEEISLQQRLMGARLDARIAEIAAPRQRLTNLRMTVALERIAPELVEAFGTLSRESASAPSADERRRISRQALGRVPWGDVARAEPLVALERFEADAGSGPVRVSARLGLNAPPQGGAGLRMLDLPRHGHAKLSLRAPEAVVLDTMSEIMLARSADLAEADARRSARQRLEALVGQGWVRRDEGGYHTTASYDRGMIRINGNSLFGF